MPRALEWFGQMTARPYRVTVVCLVAAALSLGTTSASADNCDGSERCNVQAQRSPSIAWPIGVSAIFPTMSGAVTNTIVNSVSVYADLYDIVETGWYLGVGHNRYQPFAVNYIEGSYSQYAMPAPPAGNYTWQYTLHAGTNATSGCGLYTTHCYFVDINGDGINRWHFVLQDANVWNGYAITNAERHDITDTFGGMPTFSRLQVLSSSAWSAWPAASCFTSSDLQYGESFSTNPTVVQVYGGPPTC